MEEVPVTDGAKGDWNGLVKDALGNLKNVHLADTAEGALRDLFAQKLREAGPDVPQQYVDQMAAQLASALRRAPFTFGAIDRVAGGAESFLADSAGYLQQKLTFTELKAKVVADARARGGLNPGEDVVINRDQIAPAAKGVVAEAAKIKAKAYFDPGLKIDVKKLFSSPEHMIEDVSASSGVKFEKGDFRANVGVKVDLLSPTAPDASAKVTGYAELTQGNFGARVEGSATVLDLYTDPKLFPQATLAANLHYTDPDLGVTAHLEGELQVPLEDGAATRWKASGGLDEKFNDNISVGIDGTASGGTDVPTSYGVEGTLKVVW
jgi:hypothetical protein